MITQHNFVPAGQAEREGLGVMQRKKEGLWQDPVLGENSHGSIFSFQLVINLEVQGLES